jgi:hypothetical protein
MSGRVFYKQWGRGRAECLVQEGRDHSSPPPPRILPELSRSKILRYSCPQNISLERPLFPVSKMISACLLVLKNSVSELIAFLSFTRVPVVLIYGSRLFSFCLIFDESALVLCVETIELAFRLTL